MIVEIKQMMDSPGWKAVEAIIERTKQDFLHSTIDNVIEKRVAYQTLENLKEELKSEITA